MANPLQTDEEIDAAAREFAANLPAVQQQAQPVDPVMMNMLRSRIANMEKGPAFSPPVGKPAPSATALSAIRSAIDESNANMSGGPNRSVAPKEKLVSEVPADMPTPEKIRKRRAEMDIAAAAGLRVNDSGNVVPVDPETVDPRSINQFTDAEYNKRANMQHVYEGIGLAPKGPASTNAVMAGMGRTVHYPLLSGDQAQQYSDATEKQLAHLSEMADLDLDIARARGEANAEFANAQANAIERRNAQVEALRAEKDAYVSNKLGELEASSQRIASSQVDPEQYFSGPLGGIGRIIAAAAVGMGQYSAAKSGGQNAAMAIINDSINRNVRAQEVNLSNQKDAFGIQSNLFRQNLAAFGDREQAIEATKINYLDLAKTQVDKTFATIQKGPAADAGFNEMQAKIAEQRAKSIAVLADLMNAKTAEQQSFKMQQSGGYGGIVDTRTKDQKKLDFEIDEDLQRNSAFIPSLGVVFPKSIGQSVSDKTITGLQEQNALMMTLRASNRARQQYLEESAWKNPLKARNALRKQNALAYKAAQQLSQLLGQATIRDSELERQLRVVGGEMGYSSIAPVIKEDIKYVNSLIKQYEGEHNARIKTVGGLSAERVIVTGPDGVKRPRIILTGKQDVTNGPGIDPTGGRSGTE